MNKLRTKRVVGSAEVSYDAQGNLLATNFRAYRKSKEPSGRALSVVKKQYYSVYEYLEHYNIVIPVHKDVVRNTRLLIEALLDALVVIEKNKS